MSNKNLKKAPESNMVGVMRSGALTAVLAAALSAALLAAAAAVVSRVDIPNELYGPITTVIAAAATLLASYITAQKRGAQGLSVGAASGAVLFAALAVLSAIFTERGVTGQSLVKLLALLSAGGAGGLLGVSRDPAKRRAAKRAAV